MKVVLTKAVGPYGTSYTTLTLGGEYEVLGFEGNWLRILDDQGDPFLFEMDRFEIVDASHPGFWQYMNIHNEKVDANHTDVFQYRAVDDDGLCGYPPEWLAELWFFPDVIDNVPGVKEGFWRDLRRYYPETARKFGSGNR
jgi:hypothetical protein